jgi:hypothetical protein
MQPVNIDQFLVPLQQKTTKIAKILYKLSIDMIVLYLLAPKNNGMKRES